MMQPDPTVYPPDKVDKFYFAPEYIKGASPVVAGQTFVRFEDFVKTYEALQKACELLTACGYVGVY
jgi:hypothetical protein